MHDVRDMTTLRALQRSQCPLLHSLHWSIIHACFISQSIKTGETWESKCETEWSSRCVKKTKKQFFFFFLNVFSLMFRKFNLKHKLSTQTYRQRTSCFLSADWTIFNICVFWLHACECRADHLLLVTSLAVWKWPRHVVESPLQDAVKGRLLWKRQMLVQKWGFHPHFLFPSCFQAETFAQVCHLC